MTSSIDSPIRDLSWMKQLITGIVHERFHHDGYRVVGLRPAPSDGSSYRYRLLFFPAGLDRPVLGINLESSILGSTVLTRELGGKHTKFLGPADEAMSYEEFRILALRVADEEG